MSAAQFTILGINAAKPFLDNSDYWEKKGRETVKRIRRKAATQVIDEDPRDMDYDRRMRARPRGGFIADRSKSAGDYSDYSSDEDYYRRGGGRSRGRRRSEYRNYDAYESEGSVPPRARGQMIRRNDNNNNIGPYAGAAAANANDAATNGTKSENGREEDDDSSSVISSSEDEHQEKKKQREKLITGGMATIATLNAAVNVYSSMKMRESRHKALAEGTITKEEAKKQRYKLHLQDAAAIGVSAICVKGAYAKWMQVTEKNREHRNHKQERMERREKRMRQDAERRMRSAGDENDQPYANGDAVPAQRPIYNRAYSRSVDDVRSNYDPQYQPYADYQQRKQKQYNNRRKRYDYQGYDADGGGFDGGDGGGAGE